MKTGMELPLLGLVLVVVLVMAWTAWQNMQVDIAAAQVQATAVGGSLTTPVMLAGEWIVKAFVGTIAGAFLMGLGGWIWVQVKKQVAPSEPRWKAGPNANWGREAAPRTPSETELLRLMMYQQMRANGQKMPTMVREEEEDVQIKW